MYCTAVGFIVGQDGQDDVGNTDDDVDDDNGRELHEFGQLRWMLYKGNGSLGAPQSEDTQFDVNLSSTDLLKVSKYIQVLGII